MSGNALSRDATFVVELTPIGRAAVAVVLVAGPRATKVVNDCFTPNRTPSLKDIPFETIALGRWNSASGEELIVCRRSLDRIEIHCHGGLAAVGAVIETLTSRGCRHVSWQNWQHTECVDPVQADAQIALASAPTERAAAILVDQYHGALASVVGSIVAAATAGNWAVAVDNLETVLQYRDVGLHLVSPWRVVLTGRTNVGKSSLINALSGFERAIVSNQPGTTRDVVTTTTAIDGWPVQLTDTAGLRAPADELEAAGVRLAIDTLQTADLIVAVEDAASISKSSAREHNKLSTVIADVRSTRPMICVHNKIDLVPPVDRTNRRPDDDGRCEVVFTSAITGAGIAELIAVIGRTLVPVVPPGGGAVPFTPGQIGALDAACDAAKRRDAEGVVAALQPLLAR